MEALSGYTCPLLASYSFFNLLHLKMALYMVVYRLYSAKNGSEICIPLNVVYQRAVTMILKH